MEYQDKRETIGILNSSLKTDFDQINNDTVRIKNTLNEICIVHTP